MAKYVCSVCGYVYEGDEAPEQCPVCKAPAEKFVKQEGDLSWASEHVVGVAQGAPEDIIADLRANFNGECSEVGMYHTEKAILKSVFTGKKLLTKKLNTQQSLLNYSVKLSQIQQRKILK